MSAFMPTWLRALRLFSLPGIGKRRRRSVHRRGWQQQRKPGGGCGVFACRCLPENGFINILRFYSVRDIVVWLCSPAAQTSSLRFLAAAGSGFLVPSPPVRGRRTQLRVPFCLLLDWRGCAMPHWALDNVCRAGGRTWVPARLDGGRRCSWRATSTLRRRRRQNAVHLLYGTVPAMPIFTCWLRSVFRRAPPPPRLVAQLPDLVALVTRKRFLHFRLQVYGLVLQVAGLFLPGCLNMRFWFFAAAIFSAAPRGDLFFRVVSRSFLRCTSYLALLAPWWRGRKERAVRGWRVRWSAPRTNAGNSGDGGGLCMLGNGV